MPNQLVVIDPSVANYRSLIDQLGTSYSYLLLSADSDGVAQLAGYVATRPGFDAIHLISHGSPGQVSVGTSTLSATTISSYTSQLNQIGASLNPGGDLLIYGCDVAQGGVGQRLLTDLSRLTRLDVAGSTNRTGSSGDWILEASTGPIENPLPQIQFFGDLPTAPTVSWTRLTATIPTENALALTTGLDGAVYMAGSASSEVPYGQTSAEGPDAFITKFTADGTKVWTKLIGSTGTEQANALTTDLDGSVYVAGYTNSPTLESQVNSGGTSSFVTKFGADGTKVWTKLIGLNTAQAMTTGLDGGVYVAGEELSTTPGGQAGNLDVFLTKLATDGTKVWTKLIGSTGFEYVRDLTTGSDGSVYVTGNTSSTTLEGQANAGNTDGFVTKFAADGTKVWTRLIGTTGFDTANALTTGLDGSVYVAGNASSTSLDGVSSSGAGGAFLTKFATDGTKVWTKVIETQAHYSCTSLTTGLDGSVYLAGTTDNTFDGQSTSGYNDVFVTKFAADGTKVWTKIIGSIGDDGASALTTGLDGAVYVAGGTYSPTLEGQTNGGFGDAFVIKLIVDSTPSPVCFARGTLIQTASGLLPVEELQPSDPLSSYRESTSNDPVAFVKWIGRQTFHPVIAAVVDYLPIKISAHALGPGHPFQDLYVSPDHAILFDGTLIHAKVLVNGVSILQMWEWQGNVEYFHIETEHHELIYANGLPAETFIDNVSRRQFDNYAEYEAKYPNEALMFELDLPRVRFQRQLSKRTRKRLFLLEAQWLERREASDGQPGTATNTPAVLKQVSPLLREWRGHVSLAPTSHDRFQSAA